jgi:histidinol phosphatase-like enzyme
MDDGWIPTIDLEIDFFFCSKTFHQFSKKIQWSFKKKLVANLKKFGCCKNVVTKQHDFQLPLTIFWATLLHFDLNPKLTLFRHDVGLNLCLD